MNAEGFEALGRDSQEAIPTPARYPLEPPAFRGWDSDGEFRRLCADIARVMARRRFPPVVSSRDLLRLEAFVYQFLYSPTRPAKDDYR